MPYPESCPECGGAFRNTGTHFTARRNEIGRHVLLELGCQNTARRFWWDFTTGSATEDGRTVPARRAANLAASTNGLTQDGHNGHAAVSVLDRFEPAPELELDVDVQSEIEIEAPVEDEVLMSPVPSETDNRLQDAMASLNDSLLPSDEAQPDDQPTSIETPQANVVDFGRSVPVTTPTLKEAFTRQLQLDRLTLRQMRSWMMSDEARRAIEVAAGATESTYERLALILFGTDLAQLLGKQVIAPANSGISAEERLELQREKARIRARLRRAAAKATRQPT